ncbi:Two component regulator propeller [Dyadobacter sp. SG02]|uniref:ligand-binding sensor domain-containing protein n=1 Tax=Dyadobacter sp. SG02 TaxID=1855291 RepID=UPI0008BD31F1|nr:two-component regulator propeller domain-containing protein [Dyadobacter sp. SG02]SEJ24459.1 Two component regulator propeller [Dyadobacter sp. SG02]
MKKCVCSFALLLFVSGTWCHGQITTNLPKSDTAGIISSHGPSAITRNIIQDRKGNIWMAAFDGIFRYDGKSFTNITSKVSSARFFSVLEDRKGNFWFGTIGSGVFYYDPNRADDKTFQHFTKQQGLIDDQVPHIYEDKSGNIWFGTLKGLSRYDGKQFRNYRANLGPAFTSLESGDLPPDDHDDVNAIVEDKNGKFWLGTRGNARVYDGKISSVLVHNGQTFTNVRTIIEDSKGNVWLAGQDGLWRYDGITFTNISDDFVGYVYEDRKGNIWTSSENAVSGKWGISRYDKNTLSDKKPTAIKIASEYGVNERMTFGILEANDGSIWFGSLDGVYRYDGNSIKGFKRK